MDSSSDDVRKAILTFDFIEVPVGDGEIEAGSSVSPGTGAGDSVATTEGTGELLVVSITLDEHEQIKITNEKIRRSVTEYCFVIAYLLY